MTGHKDYNKEILFDVERVLRDFGFDVFNPARNMGIDWLGLIAHDILELGKCQIVIFLKGWEESPGCRIEHIVAQRLKLTILYANNNSC